VSAEKTQDVRKIWCDRRTSEGELARKPHDLPKVCAGAIGYRGGVSRRGRRGVSLSSPADEIVATESVRESMSHSGWATMLPDGGTDLTGLRCLVVEDVSVMADAERRLLCRLGAQVVVAGTLQDARRFLAEEAFDVAIVDIGLPDGDGSEIVRVA